MATKPVPVLSVDDVRLAAIKNLQKSSSGKEFDIHFTINYSH
jgi:hypothetical protein